MGLCVSSHLLHEASQMRLSRTLTYGDGTMASALPLLLCSFSRMLGLGFPIGPMTSLVLCLHMNLQGLWQHS